ncbi:hypothetical protein [Arthrobacter sp. SD76]|uniref:hypothetical protein n=1 Tax=Arthrobacter sp. SD76 TaxID=3415007 RepID=UPI003C732111
MADPEKIANLVGPDGLITLVGADGKKYRKPPHYLDNPALGDWNSRPPHDGRSGNRPLRPPPKYRNRPSRRTLRRQAHESRC